MKKMLLAMTLSAACGHAVVAQNLATPADAFKAGQDFSSSAKGIGASSGAVNAVTGAANVPKYNTAPPEKALFGGGKTSIVAPGMAKIDKCKTHVAANAYAQQECNAVNYLNKQDRTNPFFIDKATDPLMIGSKSIIQHPGTLQAAGTQVCQTVKTTVPGTSTTEACSKSAVLETLVCPRHFTPVLVDPGGAIAVTAVMAANVGEWSAGTYTVLLKFKGAPSNVRLKKYQTDNYGQLWVNGVKVYDSTLNWADIRGAGTQYVEVSHETADGPVTSSELHLVSAEGADYGTFGDPGCDDVCAGVNPDIDLTALMNAGENTLVMSCVNAGGPGTCAMQISGEDILPPVAQVVSDNRCTALEERARPDVPRH